MELSSKALEIATSRYFMEGENWEDCCRRVGRSIASQEEKKNSWAEVFASEIFGMNFIPGGRILRNSGRTKQSMLNCAALPVGDSIEEIGDTIKNSLILWSYGAGIGIDFSPLRPVGSPLLSKGGKSSGLVSFLKAIDAVAHTIETGGQRRSGCLGMCKVSHPEVASFIRAKHIDKQLTYFNLSVAVDHSFLQAVEEDSMWNFTFAGKIHSSIKARELWDLILESMIISGDPGLINYDNLSKNNSYYFQPISVTNLCGELPLPAWGSCCLGSLVLPNFVAGKTTNWKKLRQTIFTGVRFLDNVLDVNFYPIPQMELVTKASRRIGLGVMGLHDYLLMKQMRYGGEKSLDEIEKLFRFIRDTAYEASVDLAKEKGSFPAFSRREYCNASFVKKLPPKLRMYIKDNSIRNTCVLSAPPTGTTSLIPEVSSGIEPVFSLAHRRADRVSERVYIHPIYKEYLTSGNKERPEWLVDCFDLTPIDHFEVQLACQKYIDSAASKTINCPENTTKEELSRLLLEFISDLKGITVYVDKSKDGQVLQQLSFDEALSLIESSNGGMEVASCARGVCEL